MCVRQCVHTLKLEKAEFASNTLCLRSALTTVKILQICRLKYA